MKSTQPKTNKPSSYGPKSKFAGYLRYWPFLIIVFTVVLMYQKTFFHGLIPFPGDLLLSEYTPWRHTSYNGYVAGSIPSKGQYFDIVRELYPWKTLVNESLKNGQIPLWNPHNFSGAPLLANYQSQVFYPFASIYLTLPQPIAWGFMVILQSLLGLTFMYWYGRTVGLSKTASLTASLLWNFSAFASIWMEFTTVWHTILWLPLLLVIIERSLADSHPNRKSVIAFAVATAVLLTAGHPQDSINTLLFAGFYAIFRTMTRKGSPKTNLLACIFWGIAVSLGLGVAAIQLLPTAELFGLSARVPHDPKNVLTMMLFQWWQAPIIIVQDFFGNPATKSYLANDSYTSKAISIGTTGFFLAIIPFFNRRKTVLEYLFIGTAVFFVAITFNSPITTILFKYPIPILSTGTPTRNLFVFGFAMAMLAGYGVEHIRKMERKDLILYGLTSVAILSGLWIFAKFGAPKLPSLTGAATMGLGTIGRSMILATGLTVLTVGFVFVSSKFNVVTPVIYLFCAAELFLSFTKFNPFVPVSYVFPENALFSWLKTNGSINRFWGYGTARIESDFASQTDTYQADGTDPLNIRWENALIQSSNTGKLPTTFTSRTRSDAIIQPGYGIRELPDNAYRLRILDITGTKYIIDRVENPKSEVTFPEDRYKIVAQHPDGWVILENLRAAPRFFLTGSILPYKSDEDFSKQFFDPATDITHTILLTDTDAATIKTGSASAEGKAELIAYRANEVSIKTTADADQMLFLSDTYAPGWKATIDGKLTPVYRADYAYRAVAVPSGTHTVRFTYEPQSFKRGMFVSLGCIGALFVLAISGIKRRNTTKD